MPPFIFHPVKSQKPKALGFKLNATLSHDHRNGLAQRLATTETFAIECHCNHDDLWVTHFFTRVTVGKLSGHDQCQYWHPGRRLRKFSVVITSTRQPCALASNLDGELIQHLKSVLPEYSLAKRDNAFALVSSDERSFGAQIVGVEADKEDQISSIPGNIKQGRYLSLIQSGIEAPGEIILGETLAKNLQVKTGDRVTVLGSGRDGSLAADSLQVVGIFATGLKALDRQLAQMSIARFDSTFSMAGQIHGWVLIDPQHDLLARYPKSLQQSLKPFDLKLRSWREMQPALLNAILLDISSAITMYVVLILVIVFPC